MFELFLRFSCFIEIIFEFLHFFTLLHKNERK